MISVIVVTKDEEGQIESCLESVKWADEIIVYDNGSTDKTLDLARKFTKNIFKFEGQDYAQMRNEAFKKASGDWVLYVDADERVLEPLHQELLEIAQSSRKSAFAISRRNIIFGQETRYGPFWPDWVIRFFQKNKFKTWIGKIHEYGTFEGELGYTENSFLHLTHRDLDQIILKSLHWSNFDAKLRIEAHHPKMTGWRFLRIFMTEVFNQGVKRRGLLNGSVGTMDSLLQAFSLYMTYVRLWQLQQPTPLSDIYHQIDDDLLKSNFRFK